MKSPHREEGQGLVEYALILVLVALAVILILTLLGPVIAVTYAEIIGGLNGQTIDRTGPEVVVGATADVTRAGNLCTASVPAGATIIAIQDGQPIKNATVTITIYANGTAGGSTSATTNGSGIGTTSGALSVTELCPAAVSYGLTP